MEERRSSEALDLAEQALALCKRAQDEKTPIVLKLAMSEYKLQSDEYISAEDLAEEALKAAQDISDDAQEAEAWQVLSTVRLALAVAESQETKEEIDTTSATEASRSALAAFRDLGNRQGEAKAMYKLAQVRYYAEAYDTARMGAEEAQVIFREVGEVIGEADAVLLVAFVLRSEEQYEAALHQAKKAMNIYQRADHSVGVESCTQFLDRVKESQAEKKRQKEAAKKKDGSTTKAGVVKLVNQAEEASHLLSFFCEKDDDEDTELTEFDLSAWGKSTW
jgi:tetratricopeptide (TPR) repeat protein